MSQPCSFPGPASDVCVVAGSWACILLWSTLHRRSSLCAFRTCLPDATVLLIFDFLVCVSFFFFFRAILQLKSASFLYGRRPPLTTFSPSTFVPVFVLKLLVCVCECTAADLGCYPAGGSPCLERKPCSSLARSSLSFPALLRDTVAARLAALPASFKAVRILRPSSALRVVVSGVSSALILCPMKTHAERLATTSTLLVKANVGPCDSVEALLRRPAAVLAKSLVMAYD